MAAVSILRSYRWRRRLLVIALVVATAAPLIYLGVHYSTPGTSGEPTGPAVVPESIYAEPTRAPFTVENQREVRRVLKDFITAAVAREDARRSWDLVAPSMKEGFTRKQWSRGDMPVVPYPAAKRGLGSWSYVEYSYVNSVGLEVFLFPKAGSGYSALTADVELVKGRSGRWLVGYWMPKKFHGPPAVASTAKAKRPVGKARPKSAANAAGAAPQPAEAAEPGRPSRVWWLVPIGVLSLVVLAPLTIILGVWYRNRKAERDYLRSSGRVS
jgi:hypothetical protein